MRNRLGRFALLWTPLLALFLALFLALAPAGPACARGALGYDQDQCVIKIGPDFLYFSGYQSASAQRKFCEDAPAIGETTFVFDYGQDELRQMKADFRILRDTGETSDDGGPIGGPSLALSAATALSQGHIQFHLSLRRAGRLRRGRDNGRTKRRALGRALSLLGRQKACVHDVAHPAGSGRSDRSGGLFLRRRRQEEAGAIGHKSSRRMLRARRRRRASASAFLNTF